MQNKEAYGWIASYWTEENNEQETVTNHAYRACIYYLLKVGECPKGIDGLISWILHNPSNIEEFRKSLAYEDELRSLRDDYEPMELDDTVLFHALMDNVRDRWLSFVLRYAERISSGAAKPDKNQEETGPTAAIQ